MGYFWGFDIHNMLYNAKNMKIIKNWFCGYGWTSGPGEHIAHITHLSQDSPGTRNGQWTYGFYGIIRLSKVRSACMKHRIWHIKCFQSTSSWSSWSSSNDTLLKAKMEGNAWKGFIQSWIKMDFPLEFSTSLYALLFRYLLSWFMVLLAFP